VPDIPRFVEARAILLRGRCLAQGRAGLGHVIADLDQGLAVVLGRPPLDLLVDAVERAQARDVLVEEAGAEHLARALPGWRAEGAVIHEWPGGAFAPGSGAAAGGARLLARGEPLGHVPADLRSEIEEALGQGPVAAACVDGRPVSFCYAGSETETLWDVSIDTLEEHRRRGLARHAFLFEAARQAAAGRRPVWGALDSNLPSLHMAEALGFKAMDRLVVFAAGASRSGAGQAPRAANSAPAP
jgi:hypothetical protein